ncbi:hypothetical protein [Massilia sp. TS11]|uniref:hypothetical protein n=1 Tax=Massilia sp. TS11 TaxID=2908003 RepID=UPI001EDC513F|nr:hypothetical protein [Massilia sp. TS11]MCG2585966.1 hypothetical protein [Massilia sp. TS11]
MEFRIRGTEMKATAILAAFCLVAFPLAAFSAEDDMAFAFPVRVEKTLALNQSDYEIRLHDLPGKGATGFAWSVMRNGYLLKIEMIDGYGPALTSIPTLHSSGFGLLYKSGARQSVLDLVVLSKGSFHNLMPGRISSNLACIYRGNNNAVFAVSESGGQFTIERFVFRDDVIKTLPPIRTLKSQSAGILRECSEKSYFAEEVK